MNTYTMKFKTGTSRHDEKCWTKDYDATDFKEAGAIAEIIANRRNAEIISITRKVVA